MKAELISWKNYRNLKAGELLPCDSINVIYGKNAQGKTNLMEALWLFTGGRSFRGAKDSELIAKDCEMAEVKLDFYSEERKQTAKIRIENGRRTAELNSVQKKSCSELIGKFRAVIFSPEHISLVSGGPVLRRNFIDSALCQLKPGYASILANYNHTLFQRNALLKDIPRHSELLDTLDIWDTKIIKYGEYILEKRIDFLEKLKGFTVKIYGGICEKKETISLKYVKSAENLRVSLKNARKTDILSGFTSVGPHRDDIEILINSMNARAYASQGQKRSAVLALKLAEAEVFAEAAGENPVVLLDDVMSELDSERQNYLLNHLDGFQVFITCCEPETVKAMKNGKIFKMDGGKIFI